MAIERRSPAARNLLTTLLHELHSVGLLTPKAMQKVPSLVGAPRSSLLVRLGIRKVVEIGRQFTHSGFKLT